MVGDNPINDIEPARKLGMKTILYADNLSKGNYCIKNIEELMNIL